MKIGIIQPRISYYQGGGEKNQIFCAKYLALKGHEVIIYTLKTPKKSRSFFYKSLLNQNLKNIKIREFDVPKKYQYIFLQKPGEDRNRWDSESLLFNQLIFDNLQKDPPDIIMSCYILDGVFRPLNIPAVLYLVGYPNDKVEVRKSFLRFFDAVVSISSNVEDKWGEYLNEIKLKYVVNQGVEIDTSDKKIDSPYPKNVVFAGRLVERKGVVTLIKSISKLIKEFPDLHLWILGDGPQKEQIIEMIKKENLISNVSVEGVVDNVNDYFRMADICVFPSYEKEGLMATVMEAMSVGKAVITTKNNGNEDIINSGKTGILIEPKNCEQLVDAIRELLINPDKRDALGKAAKNYVVKNLSWEKATDKLLKTFRDLEK